VLAIDLDPQGHLGKVLGVDVHGVRHSALDLLLPRPEDDAALDGAADGLPRVATRIPGLDLIPGNKSLALAPGLGSGEADVTGRMRAALAGAPELGEYDVVLVDAPASFGALTLSALRAVDEVVVPVPLTFLALDGCAELCRTLETVRTRYDHRDLALTMVIPTFYRRTRLAGEVLERLARRFPKELAHTVVGQHVKLDEAQSRGLSIFEYAPRDRAAVAMAALVEELELRRPEPREGCP
jgi:chromosome partitioning protein